MGLALFCARSADHAAFLRRERRDRTQEVAGSSPASSMKPPQSGGFSYRLTAPVPIQALAPAGVLNCPTARNSHVSRGILERERQGSGPDFALREIEIRFAEHG